MDLSDPQIPNPPPPQGERLAWQQVPATVREAVEAHLGSPVASAESQPSGFSPGAAARLRLADGRRFFAKAAGPLPNPDAAGYHRREAQVVSSLPAEAPVPRSVFTHDEGEGGWVVLVSADIEGVHPQQPWRQDELGRVIREMDALSGLLTPSPLSPEFAGTAADAFAARLCGWQRLLDEQPARLEQLDVWTRRHIDLLADLEQQAVTAVAGDALLHFDLRADNMLLTPERVWFVDWPHVCIGAAWVDVVLFAPSVTMQGGPPPEDVAVRHPAYAAADPAAVTAAVVATAGFFTHRSVQPPPPGLPTLRAFQAAQGVIARQWVAQRTGWR